MRSWFRKRRTKSRYDVAVPAPMAPVPTAAAVSAVAAAAPRKRAVLVAHGMGQQMPFKTLVDVAEALEEVDAARRGVTVDALARYRATSVEVDGVRLQRLELSLEGGSSPHEVHVYEAYWAPITEGRISLRDVVAFLVRAGLNGLLNGLVRFHRWVFGELREYAVPHRAAFQLLLALAIVAALVTINAVIVAVAAARSILDGTSPWLTEELFAELSALLNVEIAAVIVFGVVLAISSVIGKMAVARALTAVTRLLFFVLVALTLAVAAGVGFVFWAHAHGGGHGAHTLDLLAFLREHLSGPPLLRVFVWPAVIAASAFVRELLVQYVGDVAAYVSSHRLDRFNDIRNEIKDCVHRVAHAVYALRTPDGSAYEYEQVAVVGHSLGSVIVYDCLNSLLNDDALYANKQSLEVQARTSLLLTFGSPLDKTAYVFGTRGAWRVREGREALAATVQPLVQSQSFRSFPWVNVYSRNDVVSGPLDFYDLPDKSNPGAVANLEDPEATTWLAAHVEYWRTKLVWERLYAVLTA